MGTDEMLAKILNELVEVRKGQEELGQRWGQFENCMEQFGDRMDRFENRMEQFEDRMEQFGDRMDRFENRMGQFEDRMEQLGDHMDRFENRMGQFEDRMDRFEDRMAKFEERVTKVEIILENDVATKLNLIYESQADTIRRYRDWELHEQEISSLKDRVFVLEQVVSRRRARRPGRT